jgi:phage terminase large subunit-like protein
VVALAAGPRVRSVRAWDESLGDEAIELASRAGLDLFDWQQDALRDILALDDSGRWAHFEFGLNVARQNGKGAVLEARELAMLAGITDEEFGVHSAHEFKTAEEHFFRVQALLEESGLRVKTIRRGAGNEGIVMMDGRRLRFVTRTKSGLKGFAGVDYLNLDESMIIGGASHGAMMPTLRASDAPRGPQLIYTGNAADQEIHDKAVVWARIRERGLRGDDEALGYIEYSIDCEHPDDVPDEVAIDREQWPNANPTLGLLITAEHMERERRSMDPRTFATELLNVGDYPATDGADERLISDEEWAALLDPESRLVDPVCLSYDVSPERHASICAAGRNERGDYGVEIIASNSGTGWLVDKLVDLYRSHEIAEVVCDGFGPSAAIAKLVDEAGITVRRLDSGDYGKACGFLVDQVGERKLRHLGQPELDNAIKGARARPLVDRWAWSRTKSTINISPLVAATLALWSAHENDVGQVEIF